MLENNLHPDVAERPEELVVYGGLGKAARNRDVLRGDRERAAAARRRGDAARAVGQARGGLRDARGGAARADRQLQPRPEWATWKHFRELDAAGLMMYGQMTAGSWIYIGTQGILQGTYETFAALARQALRRHARRPPRGHRRTRRHGRRPAARDHDERRRGAVRRGGPAPHRAPHSSGYLDERAGSTWTTRCGAWTRPARAVEPLSIGLLGNAAEVIPELVRRGVEVDVVTDQTSAHDPLNGYIPAGLTRRAGRRAARVRPRRLPAPRGRERARARGRRSARCRARAPTPSTTATPCAASPRSTATSDAFAYPGFVPAYIRPLFCEGRGPFRWVALSGDPADIHATDAAMLELFGEQDHRWRAGSAWPRRRCSSRACRRASAGSATASATGPACASTRWSPRGELNGADRDRARPPRLRDRSPRPSARPRACRTAPTPWPTGRC